MKVVKVKWYVVLLDLIVFVLLGLFMLPLKLESFDGSLFNYIWLVTVFIGMVTSYFKGELSYRIRLLFLGLLVGVTITSFHWDVIIVPDEPFIAPLGSLVLASVPLLLLFRNFNGLVTNKGSN